MNWILQLQQPLQVQRHIQSPKIDSPSMANIHLATNYWYNMGTHVSQPNNYPIGFPCKTSARTGGTGENDSIGVNGLAEVVISANEKRFTLPAERARVPTVQSPYYSRQTLRNAIGQANIHY